MTLAERLSSLSWGGEGYSEYQGFCKGGHSAAEQQAADQQRQLETQLMQTQLNKFNQQMNSVNAVLNPMIAQGGLPPQVVSALRSQALNELGNQFKSGTGQLNQALVARGMTGGPMAGSGGVAQGFGALNALQAGLQTNALQQIPLMQNDALMRELALKSGNAQMYAGLVSPLSSGANSALSSGVTAAHNADQAASSFWGPLLGSLAGVGMGFATGGASLAFPGMSPGAISASFGGPGQAQTQPSADTTPWSVR